MKHDAVEIYVVTKDNQEVFLCDVFDLGDAGKMLKTVYPHFADLVEEVNIKWSQIKEFRIKLPDGYLVD